MITIIKCNYNLMPSDTREFNAWVKIKPKGKKQYLSICGIGFMRTSLGGHLEPKLGKKVGMNYNCN